MTLFVNQEKSDRLAEVVDRFDVNTVVVILHELERGFEMRIKMREDKEESKMVCTYQRDDILMNIDQGKVPVAILSGLLKSKLRYFYEDYCIAKIIDRRRAPVVQTHYVTLRMSDSGIIGVSPGEFVSHNRVDFEQFVVFRRNPTLDLDSAPRVSAKNRYIDPGPDCRMSAVHRRVKQLRKHNRLSPGRITKAALHFRDYNRMCFGEMRKRFLDRFGSYDHCFSLVAPHCSDEKQLLESNAERLQSLLQVLPPFTTSDSMTSLSPSIIVKPKCQSDMVYDKSLLIPLTNGSQYHLTVNKCPQHDIYRGQIQIDNWSGSNSDTLMFDLPGGKSQTAELLSYLHQMFQTKSKSTKDVDDNSTNSV